MTLLAIDHDSAVPPFEQLRTQVATMTVTGELEPGQKLPTVRQLATDLGLATNTVARAYRELEADGVISTQGRRGTFVRSTLFQSPAPLSPEAAARRAAMTFTTTARRNGMSLAEATRLIEAAWPRTTN
ncbi:MAG: GntR family transcriptional regulator [Propionibacteriales bacterium]|jgi:DNA-binding transcriptional regulator YhcF (GntR family)|nr:GntR family transcriptional regulator [Propionibacteriales bacterium]